MELSLEKAKIPGDPLVVDSLCLIVLNRVYMCLHVLCVFTGVYWRQLVFTDILQCK